GRLASADRLPGGEGEGERAPSGGGVLALAADAGRIDHLPQPWLQRALRASDPVAGNPCFVCGSGHGGDGFPAKASRPWPLPPQRSRMGRAKRNRSACTGTMGFASLSPSHAYVARATACPTSPPPNWPPSR